MTECPVCRSPVLGRPESCSNCGTPLEKSRHHRWFFMISLLFPGVAQLLRGYLLAGSLAILGSFTFGLFIIFSWFQSIFSLTGLLIAGILWIIWTLSWGLQAINLRPQYVDGDLLLGLLVGLLIFFNCGAFVFWLILTFSKV
ncbi:MAG: hypothetical protein ACQEP7_01175 [bacterium]